jgi:hypothetical protein
MNDQDIQELIENALFLASEENDEEWEKVESIRSFDEEGVLTMNKGLVLRMEDGSEFQITIVQSRVAR